MIIIRIQRLQKSNAAPTSPKDNKLRFMLQVLLLLRVVIIYQMIDNGEVLWPASSRVERVFGDVEIDKCGVLAVRCCIVGEKGEDQEACSTDEDTKVCEAFPQPANDPGLLFNSGRYSGCRRRGSWCGGGSSSGCGRCCAYLTGDAPRNGADAM